MKDNNYKTSVAYMLEIAREDLEQHVAPDKLRTFRHDPAPKSLGSPKSAVGGQVESISTATASLVRGIGSGILRNPNGKCGGQIDSSGIATTSRGSGIGSGLVPTRKDKNRLDGASEVIDFLDQASNYGHNIATVFRHGISLALLFPHDETKGNVLRRARISCWRMGKATAQAADVLETAQQVCALAKNFHAARGKFQLIIKSPTEPWDVMTARIGAEVAAISLKTIAQIGWEVPHKSIGYARTAAAFFGADVSHPAFDSKCSWRTWVSWQSVNFWDARIGYLTETVYDGDTIYAFVHTHIR
jgi:hypothetical protein